MFTYTVEVANRSYRTHALENVGRRLYGPKTVTIINTHKKGKTFGLYAVPDRKNRSQMVIKDWFIADDEGEIAA